MFLEHFGTVQARNGGGTNLREPYLWKASGDELIFSVPLQHPAHVRLYLKAFRLSLNQASKSWTMGENPLPISFKGTAWLADFPVFNSAVPMEAENAQNTPLSADSEHLDFIGPLIDIGFRLAKFATPRKFVVSADIAWLVTHSGDTAGLDFSMMAGNTSKGCSTARPIPFFGLIAVTSTRLPSHWRELKVMVLPSTLNAKTGSAAAWRSWVASRSPGLGAAGFFPSISSSCEVSSLNLASQ